MHQKLFQICFMVKRVIKKSHYIYLILIFGLGFKNKYIRHIAELLISPKWMYALFKTSWLFINIKNKKNSSCLKWPKKWRRPQKWIWLPPLQEYYLQFLLMTSHLDSHRTTDIKPEMLSGVETGNGTPHDKHNICGIAHVHTNRKKQHFHAKTTVHWRSTHGAGHIRLCGIFLFLSWSWESGAENLSLILVLYL